MVLASSIVLRMKWEGHLSDAGLFCNFALGPVSSTTAEGQTLAANLPLFENMSLP